jgi:hypothetical protein
MIEFLPTSAFFDYGAKRFVAVQAYNAPSQHRVRRLIVPNFIVAQKGVIHKTHGSRGRISRVHPAHPPMLE